MGSMPVPAETFGWPFIIEARHFRVRVRATHW